MFDSGLFRRPATRAQALTEIVLVALLAIQPGLWAWTLTDRGRGDAKDSVMLTEAAAAPHFTTTSDPFFVRLSTHTSLLPHTLYAVRTGERAGAILAGHDGIQRAVTVGETVSEGVVLAAVASDHVILAHGGAHTRLDFPASPPPSLSPAPPSTGVASGYGAPGAGAADASTYATALRPVSGNGADGYVWRPGADGGVLAAAGLRPGDVIVRLNGTPFDRAERMEELAGDIAAGHAVDLEYKRNGQIFSARYTPD
ncbi:MAG: type II secretion system protein N [Brevundimonas sp.]|uniref:type II secretion system protein N n=1 Tax=Brevundimonas sp. TaxID=1871086 RepID=UPI00391D72E4